jgi:hypothetical protein
MTAIVNFRTPQLKVYASEVAALIKQNSYLPFEASLIRFWARQDPRTFNEAKIRNNFTLPIEEVQTKLKDTQVLRLAHSSVNVSDVRKVEYEAQSITQIARLSEIALSKPTKLVELAAERAVAQAKHLSAAVRDNEADLNSISLKRKELESKTQEAALRSPEHQHEVRTVQDIEKELHKKRAEIQSKVSEFALKTVLAETSSVNTELAIPAKALKQSLEQFESQITTIAEKLLDQPNNDTLVQEYGTVRQQMDKHVQIAKSFVEDTSRKQLSESAIKELKGLASSAFGKTTEKEVVNKEKLEQNNRRLYSLSVNQNILLIGRIDGFRNGRLVEVKNRLHRLFEAVPEYERIQIQIYLEMLKLPEATLLQYYGGQSKETIIGRDQLWWNTFLVPKLQRFHSEFTELRQSLTKQNELLCRRTISSTKFEAANARKSITYGAVV